MNIGLISENIHVALRSIYGNRIRAILTVIGTTIGVFAVIMIIAITTGLKDNIRSQIVSLGADILDITPTNADNFGPGSATATFKKSEIEAMKKEKEIYKYFSEVYTINATFEYNNEKLTAYVIGVAPDYFKQGSRESIAGELFTQKEQRNVENVTVIGVNVADKLFSGAEKSIDRTLKVSGKEFRVIGVMEPQDIKFGQFDIDDMVYIPAATVASRFEVKGIHEVFVTVPDETRLDEYKAKWVVVLENIRQDEEFDVLGQEDLLKVVDRITGIITLALAGLASISLLVGGIGIMNIMLVSVTERTREIGIRKAVGAENHDILVQFLTESVVLSILGGLIGLIFAIIGSFALKSYIGISALINWQTVAGAMSFSIIVGVIFGTVPALKAAKKDPIEALRYDQ